jgi:hypothetical protein
LTTELIHALKWLPWSDKGFPTDKEQCPYVGYREMRRKKHKPKPEIESVARQLLDETTPKTVRNQDASQDETHTVKAIHLVKEDSGLHTLVGNIDGYTGHVWYAPYQETWIMSHDLMERQKN